MCILLNVLMQCHMSPSGQIMLLFFIFVFVSVSLVTVLQLNASSVNTGLWIERCGTIGRLVHITVGATAFLPIELVLRVTFWWAEFFR